MLTTEQRARLIRTARESIEAVLAGRRPEVDLADFDHDLQRPSGVFVTLTLEGELRGCIGSIEPVAPLCMAVSMSAINAAFRDPRFVPLSADEYRLVAVEISVMGPIERVTNLEDIVVGRDGLIVSRERRTGLLLPQVATERGWSRETFLRQTCVKAGLPPESWKSKDILIQRFSAEVLGEE